MTEMFGEAWPPMSAPDLAPDDDDDFITLVLLKTTPFPASFNTDIMTYFTNV